MTYNPRLLKRYITLSKLVLALGVIVGSTSGCGCKELTALLEEQQEQSKRLQERLVQLQDKNKRVRDEAQKNREELERAQLELKRVQGTRTRITSPRHALVFKIDTPLLKRLAEESGASVEQVLEDKVRVITTFNGRYITQVGFQASKNIIYAQTFRRGISNIKIANLWNRKNAFSRSYVDDKGDLILEADINIRGGVSQEMLKLWFKSWREATVSFHRIADELKRRGGKGGASRGVSWSVL